MRGAYLGPSFSNDAIATALDDLKAVYTKHDDDTLLPLVAKEISEGQVIGWFSDAMEFGRGRWAHDPSWRTLEALICRLHLTLK